mmetsp:Transcript_11494/g.47814  ORF Transcript_11494/g.47814 Transcript_11494/m.47814 type:complete len:117 (-) Transcript_11494:798-1148(-)
MGDAVGEGASAFDATAAAASAAVGTAPTGPSRPGGVTPGGPSALHARLAGDEGGYGMCSGLAFYLLVLRSVGPKVFDFVCLVRRVARLSKSLLYLQWWLRGLREVLWWLWRDGIGL